MLLLYSYHCWSISKLAACPLLTKDSPNVVVSDGVGKFDGVGTFVEVDTSIEAVNSVGTSVKVGTLENEVTIAVDGITMSDDRVEETRVEVDMGAIMSD